ncbi:MAG: hypothetical protein ABJG78_06295 [Cyclobacteriaceae bacterium]
MKKSDLENEIDLTLLSIDQLEKAKAPDGFMELLAKKMLFKKEEVVWTRRAKYAIAAMIIFAIVNTALLITSQSSSRDEMLRSVAEEWNLNVDAY